MRAEAKNEFEKDFFKLMNNSVFGKTMENILKHVNIKLVNNEKQAKKLAAKPNFERCIIFDENFIAIHMKKTCIVYDKPVYLGMCILDLSKTLMYGFYKDISDNVEAKFDTSSYAADHPSGIPVGVNKKVFKDECVGEIMHEFVGLRSKLYSYKMYEGNETKKCKGVKSSVVKKVITFKDYKDCLFGKLTDGKQMRTMNIIRSHRASQQNSFER